MSAEVKVHLEAKVVGLICEEAPRILKNTEILFFPCTVEEEE